MLATRSRLVGAASNDSSTGSTESNEECCKTGNYLRHLSGQQDEAMNQLLLEHNYSKPWTWKPETSFAKPTRTLFTSSKSAAARAAAAVCTGPDDEVDIEGLEEPLSSQLQCVAEADDCERYAEELRSAPSRPQPLAKEDGEDWEARVPRVGWTTEHLRLYSSVVRALHELQLGRLAFSGRADEAVQRRLAVDTAARRVRRAMASVTWDLRLTHWLHATLQEHMPTPLLAIYLEVLQTLRAKVPTLVDQMLSLSTYNRLGVPVSEELLQLLQKPWDPAAASLSQHKPRKLPLDPVLVVVPSGIGSHIGHNSRRNRTWTSQLSLLGRVATISTQAANLTGRSTVENMLDQLLALTRAKVDELKTAAPARPVILVGWNVGAAIACQAALMETVAAVVCLGFPISTLAGRRGQADDAILDLQCPILFVIGQNAPTSRQADLEELRERLRVQSGLLVVGSADDKLRICGMKKRSEGLTQSMVDRCILDEVGDFLGSVLTQPTPSPVVASPTVRVPIQAVASTPEQQAASRRQSSESTSVDRETPEAKRSRSATPMPASPASSSTPTKIMYSTAKPEASLSFNPGRSGQKRTYEASTPQRLVLGSGGGSPEKRVTSSLGLRQGQNSGITVNIGSLASLAPLGPIRLGSGEVSHQDARTNVRTAGVRVPSTPTTHASLTSLSSLLSANTTKIGTSSILLTSNATGHIKVLGGDDATSQPRTRSLDLSRVTLLTSGASKAAATQAGVVMVNTAASSGSSVLLQTGKAGGLHQTTVTKVGKATEQGSATSATILQSSSSAPLLLSSTTTTTTRPISSLSPATILELPVIFAKDGDPDHFTGAAALTAPLPVNLTDEVAAITAMAMRGGGGDADKMT